MWLFGTIPSFCDPPKGRSNNMKTTWMFSVFTMMIMVMAIAFADTTRKTSSMIPTPDEIKAVKPKIDELTRDDFAALKAKKKTNAETADVLLG